MKLLPAITSLAIFVAANSWAQAPTLPAGLGGAPSLPSGLGATSAPSLPTGLGSSAPSLPIGLGTTTSNENAFSADELEKTLFISGFAEARLGHRTRQDPNQKSFSIGEARTQIQIDKEWQHVTGRLTTDLIYDPIANQFALDLEKGRGWLDLREANLLFRPTEKMDVKVGRQILTWGTGDLVFINDLFPKDWNSFFIGRDDEYLKAPSDAIKTSFFNDTANLDIVYTPRFDPDRYIDGYRLSYYDRNNGVIAGRNNPAWVEERNSWFNEDEISMRLYRQFGKYETAAYFHSGYWQTPAGQANGRYTYPDLNVYGASIRGPLHKGIANAEIGYYSSRQDPNGKNGNVDNSEFRYLVGYEQELMPNLTASVQYYAEKILDYDNYLATLPAGIQSRDRLRHLTTLRLTKLMMNQNLKLSLFNFFSPSDADGHTRLRANYKLNDHWQIEGGGNFFYGSHRHSFFGGLQTNANVFTALRYSF